MANGKRETFGGNLPILDSFFTILWHNPFSRNTEMVHRSCSRDKLIHPGVIHRRDVFLPELGGVLGASN